MMLQANETRTKTIVDGSTVTMSWTAGGSFCQVQHREAGGKLRYNYNHVFASAALADYEARN